MPGTGLVLNFSRVGVNDLGGCRCKGDLVVSVGVDIVQGVNGTFGGEVTWLATSAA